MQLIGANLGERSIGGTVRRSSLTLAGNRRARRALVEAAWTYRYLARVSEALRIRHEGCQRLSATSPEAQIRLCTRSIVGSAPAQEAAGGRGCDRVRDGRFPMGHRQGGRAVVAVSTRPAAQRWGWRHGGELPSLVMWPSRYARRPPSRPRTAPSRRHGRRYLTRG